MGAQKQFVVHQCQIITLILCLPLIDKKLFKEKVTQNLSLVMAKQLNLQKQSIYQCKFFCPRMQFQLTNGNL